MANNTASEVYPRQFDSIKVGDHIILEEDYINYMDSLCKANIDGDRRLPQIALEKLLNWTNWGGHASNWPSFDYIETDNKIIESPSPKGLEHYTKYTTTSGVIIVGGQSVPDAAMLAARESVEYMLSMRPDFVDILKSNEARISLFGPNNDVSELPEFPDENEPGGFAMGMTDATMTANAGWLCYEGNWDTGGNPVIHELVHSINHLVFEQINEVYFYERIYSLANSAIDRGIFPPFEQNLPEGEEQDISHRVGEYWAMTVEGYIMNRAGFKNSHDTRDWISENDPELLDLIHKYYPTDEWSYCSGVENTY
jgi:hypothetical protein